MAGSAEGPELGEGEKTHEEVAGGESDQCPVGSPLRDGLVRGGLEGRGQDDPEEDPDDLGEEAECVLDGNEAAKEAAEVLRQLDQVVAVLDERGQGSRVGWKERGQVKKYQIEIE